MSSYDDAYLNEFTKLAVDAKTLLRATSAAKNVHVGRNPLIFNTGGGQTIAPPAMVGPVIDRRMNAGGAKTALGYAERFARQLPGTLGTRARAAVSSGRQAFDGALSALKAGALHNAGRIDVDPQAVEAAMGLISGRPGMIKTPAGRNALTGLVTSHELGERSVRRRDLAPLYSHLAPEVLLKEHNAVSRLTGEGADEARSALRQVRRRTGESEHMRNLLVQEFGPRAGQFMDEGEKVPKALQRALQRRIQKDPHIIERAKPGVGFRLRSSAESLREAPQRAAARREFGKRVNDYLAGAGNMPSDDILDDWRKVGRD